MARRIGGEGGGIGQREKQAQGTTEDPDAHAKLSLPRAWPQRSLPHANPGLPGFAHVLSGRSRVNPTSTGGGTGRGVTTNAESVATPFPIPPPQGGREEF